MFRKTHIDWETGAQSVCLGGNREQGKWGAGDGGPEGRVVGLSLSLGLETLGPRTQPALTVLTRWSGASVQVGKAFEKEKTERELRLIASDPKETHAFKVTNYTALGGLLSQLEQSIVPMEGEPLGPPPGRGCPLGTSRRSEPCPPAQPGPSSMRHAGQLPSPLSLSSSGSRKATRPRISLKL